MIHCWRSGRLALHGEWVWRGFSDAVTAVDMRGWAGLNEAQGIPRERNLPQNGEVWQRLLELSKSRC